jgi:hypothetical protein
VNETSDNLIRPSSKRQRLPRRLFFCFIILPALLAFLNVLRVSPLSQSLSFSDRVLFYLPSALLAWSISGIIIAGIVNLTRARVWGTLVLCFFSGAILSAVFNYYVVSGYFYLMRARWPYISQYYYEDTPILKETLLEYLTNPIATYTYLTLVLANVGYRFTVPGARYLGDSGPEKDEVSYPEIRRAMRPEPRPEDPRTPNFMTGVISRLGSDLILVEAQEHYVKVVTSAGSALVLYRLGNALQELYDYDGDRVHRSFWIAWPHVREIRRDGRSYRLCMSNGLEVPVSRSHLGVVERRMTD